MMKTKSPFDDSSDDSTTQNEPSETLNIPTKDINHSDDAQNNDETLSIKSDATKHAELLEKNMDSAMADLMDPEVVHDEDMVSSDKLTDIIQQIVNTKIDSIMTKLSTHEKDLLHAKEMYNTFIADFDHITDQINKIKTTQECLNK